MLPLLVWHPQILIERLSQVQGPVHSGSLKIGAIHFISYFVFKLGPLLFVLAFNSMAVVVHPHLTGVETAVKRDEVNVGEMVEE